MDCSLYLLQKLSSTEIAILEKELEEEQKKADEDKILCAFCQWPITARKYRTVIHGNHIHTFSNPAGIIYTIGCFSVATGCRNLSTPTFEHTWFTGFSWQYAMCKGCDNHLGWSFHGQSSTFWGLIVDRIDW